MKEDENACKWDVLSLSLVLNFVPDPKERGTRILLAGISFTPHIFREDAAVSSLVPRRLTYAFWSLVRYGRYRSVLSLHRRTGGSSPGVAPLALCAKFALPHLQPF